MREVTGIPMHAHTKIKQNSREKEQRVCGQKINSHIKRSNRSNSYNS